MSGAWVFVCGPSGAGKDSVIGWARDALAGDARIVFSRRLMTRAAPPDSGHDSVSPEAFARLHAEGRLAWSWQAHGLDYGIDARYASDVAAGRVVVVNGSREHAAGLTSGPSLRVVLVAADTGRVADRLRQRAREGPEAITARLTRNAALDHALAQGHADLQIANDGALAEAGAALQGFLLGLCR